jgi:putative flippase GtrA
VLLLVAGTLGPYLGRLISFTLAVLATWILNRSFTFAARQSGLSLHHELGRYFSAMIAGGVANYAVFAALVYFVDLVAQWPVLGVAAGSIVGLAINFALAKNWIFRSER